MARDLVHSYIFRQYMLDNNYEIYHYVDKNVRNVKLHHHDFYEIYYFISGDVEYYIEGKIYHLKPGDLVLINTTELHQAKINPGAENYQRIVLWIDKNYLNSFSTATTDLAACFEAENKQSVINVNTDIQKNIYRVFKKLIELENFRGVGKDILCKAYIMELMVKVNNLAINHAHISDDFYYNDTKRSNLINEMVDFIENNLENDISIDALSEKFFLSKYHLSREFKKYTGVTIYKYITLKRLIKAKDYILQKDSINDVYKKCGFGDYSNFFRSFKKEFGITPKEFYKIMTYKEQPS